MKTDLELLKESLSDLEWYQENSSFIRRNYEGQLVAIKGKQIVSFAPNMQLLMKKLKENKIDMEEVIIEYVPPEDWRQIL